MTERETGMEKENRLRMGIEILGEEMMKKDDSGGGGDTGENRDRADVNGGDRDAGEEGLGQRGTCRVRRDMDRGKRRETARDKKDRWAGRTMATHRSIKSFISPFTHSLIQSQTDRW